MSDQQPLVSVLTTAFNREKYIAQAIESVLASTYSNLELIVVDDCSTDRTVEIAKKYEQKDARVKVYVNRENLGDYPNRNKAASYANGKYLKYVDADDLIYPYGLEILVKSMERFPSSGWGLCNLKPCLDREYPFILLPKEAYEFNYLGAGLFHKAPLSAIIKRRAFNEVDGFRPIRMAGDFEMWHRLALKFPVVLIQEGITWYRKHSDQEMSEHKRFIQLYRDITTEYLNKSGFLFTADELNQIKKTIKRKEIKSSFKSVVARLSGLIWN